MKTEDYDAEQYLTERRIDFSKNDKNSTEGWIQVRCLWCDDPSKHLGINEDSNWINCWRCGPRGTLVDFVVEYDKVSHTKARQILSTFPKPFIESSYEESPIKFSSLEMPIGTGPINEKNSSLVHRFLSLRGFDPKFICEKYKLLYPKRDYLGKYKFRIFIPIFLNHEIVTFQTRDVTNESFHPYLSWPDDKSERPIKHCLYEIDKIKDVAVIVEGVIDQWKLGDGAIATFGINFTKEQIKLLSDKRPKKTYILFDPEPTALEQAEKLARSIWFSETIVLELENWSDPGDMPIEKGRELMNSLLGG